MGGRQPRQDGGGRRRPPTHLRGARRTRRCGGGCAPAQRDRARRRRVLAARNGIDVDGAVLRCRPHRRGPQSRRHDLPRPRDRLHPAPGRRAWCSSNDPDDDALDRAARDRDRVPVTVDVDAPRFLLYTSGSTADPKGVAALRPHAARRVRGASGLPRPHRRRGVRDAVARGPRLRAAVRRAAPDLARCDERAHARVGPRTLPRAGRVRGRDLLRWRDAVPRRGSSTTPISPATTSRRSRLFPCGGADVPPELIRRAIARLGVRAGTRLRLDRVPEHHELGRARRARRQAGRDRRAPDRRQPGAAPRRRDPGAGTGAVPRVSRPVARRRRLHRRRLVPHGRPRRARRRGVPHRHRPAQGHRDPLRREAERQGDRGPAARASEGARGRGRARPRRADRRARVRVRGAPRRGAPPTLGELASSSSPAACRAASSPSSSSWWPRCR